jgi:hypothetical protein
MKTIYDLSKEEVNQLEFEQVERYIDIACAEKGVPLLPPDVPIEPKLEKPAKDTCIYKVGNFKTLTIEDASKILEVLGSIKLVETTYDYNAGYDNNYIVANKTVDLPRIEQESVYSLELYNKVKSDLQKHDIAKKQYESERKTYNEAVKTRQDVADKIWEYVREINEEFQQKEYLTKEYIRYLDLAEGNHATAMNFFMNTFREKIENMENNQEFLETLNCGKLVISSHDATFTHVIK